MRSPFCRPLPLLSSPYPTGADGWFISPSRDAAAPARTARPADEADSGGAQEKRPRPTARESGHVLHDALRPSIVQPSGECGDPLLGLPQVAGQLRRRFRAAAGHRLELRGDPTQALGRLGGASLGLAEHFVAGAADQRLRLRPRLVDSRSNSVRRFGGDMLDLVSGG